jgi:hypothetical protein
VSHRRVATIALVLAIAPALPSPARAQPSPIGPIVGRVGFVTQKRAYLTAGRLEQLALGMTIQLSHNGQAVGRCTIDQLADHRAACPIAGARTGDSFALPASSSPATPRPVLVAPLSADALARAGQAIEAAPTELIDFSGVARKLQRAGAGLLIGSVGHAAYVTVNGSNFEQTRLELQLNGLDAHWAGFRVYAHLTTVLSSVMPPEQRFRPGDIAQVYLWEAAFSSRDTGRPFTLSVGRIWPYHTPGLTVLDGAQAGWRRKDGLAEVGVYGGLIPDAVTLYPTGDHYAAGVYFGYTLARSGAGSALKILQTDGRLGLRGAPGPGVQLELEWALMASVGRWLDFGVQARGAIGGGDWSTPTFEAGRVHLAIHPLPTLRIVAAFRYLDTKVDYDALNASLFDPRRTYDANLTLGWEPRPWLALSVISGADSAGGDTASTRGYVGPEVGLPRLFRGQGGIALGYREEIGWYSGRTVYLQVQGAIGARFRALARISYDEERPSGGTGDEPYREVGFYAFAEGRILRWLTARLTAVGRVGAYPSGEDLAAPGGLVLRAELVGRL